MNENFEGQIPEVASVSAEDEALLRAKAELERGREAASAEQEIFLDSEMLISTIENAWQMIHGTDGDQGDPDVRQREPGGALTPYGVIQQHQERFLNGWAELLYTGSINSTGSVSLRYAKALEHLRLLVGCDVFDKGTKGLHISETSIAELTRKAGAEISSSGRSYGY